MGLNMRRLPQTNGRVHSPVYNHDLPRSPFTAMSALLNYVWHHRIRISVNVLQMQAAMFVYCWSTESPSYNHQHAIATSNHDYKNSLSVENAAQQTLNNHSGLMIFCILPIQHATSYHPPNDVSPSLQSTKRDTRTFTKFNNTGRRGPAIPQTATGKQQSEQPEQRSTVLQKPNTRIVQWDDWNVDNDHGTAERIYNNIHVEDPDK